MRHGHWTSWKDSTCALWLLSGDERLLGLVCAKLGTLGPSHRDGGKSRGVVARTLPGIVSYDGKVYKTWTDS